MFYKKKTYWISVSVVVIITLIILLPIYLLNKNRQDESVKKIFNSTSQNVKNIIIEQLSTFIGRLNDLSNAFGTHGKFNHISKSIFDNIATSNFLNISLFTVSYNPFVNASDRELYESFFSNQLNESIQILTSLPNRTTVISPDMDFYVPIGYTNYETNVTGIDLNQIPSRNELINIVLNTSKTAMTNAVLYLTPAETIPVLIAMIPVMNLDNDPVAVLGLVMFINTLFPDILDKAINGQRVDAAVLLNGELLYDTNNRNLNDIITAHHINLIDTLLYNKNIIIYITANSDFDDQIIDNKINILLVVIGCISLILLLIITYLFYNNEQTNKKLLHQVRINTQGLYNQIISYFTHEMKTPMNTIYSILHYIQSDDNDDNETSIHIKKDELNVIYNSIQKLKSFIDEMMSFQKLVEGNIKLSNQTFNIIELCYNIIKQQSLNCNKDVLLVFETCNKIQKEPNVFSDPIRLSQILLNGLSNAIKFTKSGKIVLTIFIKCINNIKYLSINISNTGSGLGDINPETLFIPFGKTVKSQLFTYNTNNINMDNINNVMNSKMMAFSTILETRGHTELMSSFAKQDGSGMGLPISRSLCIRLGGYLNIYDRFEYGKYMDTNFHAVINVSNINVSDKNYEVIEIDEKSTEKCIIDEQPSNKLRIYSNKFENKQIISNNVNILIVDDTFDNLRTGKLIFNKLGYDVDTCEDGIYIDYDSINKYDIILLDIIMKHSSGYEVCNKLIDKGYTGIILATTGLVSLDDIKDYQKYGFNGVYAKPFKIKETKSFFEKLLTTRQWDVLV